jgi:hypothetical protein
MKKILATILVLVLLAAPMVVMAESIEPTIENPRVTIKRAAVAPVIDGILDADSYEKLPFVQGHYWFNDQGDGHMAFLQDPNNVQAYFSYDDTNMYVFISKSDQLFFNDRDQDDSGNIWNRSSIQFAGAPISAFGSDFIELGFAINNDGQLINHVWFEGVEGPAEFEGNPGVNFMVARAGGRINYELAIPWNTFLPGTPAVGTEFFSSFIVHFYDNDAQQGSNDRMQVEFASGIANNGKNADQGGIFTVSGDILAAAEEVVEADEPEAQGGSDDAPAPRPTPRTGDAGTIALIALMAIAAAGIVVIRRKAVK